MSKIKSLVIWLLSVALAFETGVFMLTATIIKENNRMNEEIRQRRQRKYNDYFYSRKEL